MNPEKKEKLKDVIRPQMYVHREATENIAAGVRLNPDLVNFLVDKHEVPEEVVYEVLYNLPPRVKIFHMLKCVGKEEVMDSLLNDASKTQ